MVVALTNPAYRAADRTSSSTAVREQHTNDPVEKGANWLWITTPEAFSGVSLLVDTATDTTHIGQPHSNRIAPTKY